MLVTGFAVSFGLSSPNSFTAIKHCVVSSW